jgi:hypothetical protein
MHVRSSRSIVESTIEMAAGGCENANVIYRIPLSGLRVPVLLGA